MKRDPNLENYPHISLTIVPLIETLVDPFKGTLKGDPNLGCYACGFNA